MHKRRAEMETAARMDDEEELDDFPSPHFGAASDFGAAGGSGERLAFRGEVPSPAKRRSGNFPPPPHPQVALFLTTENPEKVKNRFLLFFAAAGKAGIQDKP